MEFLTPYWNQAIVEPLTMALQFIASFTGSGGLAIILMTLIIKTILLPFSLKQTASMKKMQALQPEIAAIKKKYKEREKVTQETMALYKERGVNPAAGCLPMLPTMVVLFGLYWSLQNLAHTNEEFQQPFLWVPRLDHPDVFQLFGATLPGILPIAMAITQFFSSKMMTMPSADPQQASMNRMMTLIMPGMMLFWGVTFPAGLVLYWFVSNLYEMGRLYFTMGPDSLKMDGMTLNPKTWFAIPAPEQPEDRTRGNGKLARDEVRSGDIPGGEPRASERPTRPRNKRGRRSGRR